MNALIGIDNRNAHISHPTTNINRNLSSPTPVDNDDYIYLENGTVPNTLSKGMRFGHINICSLIGKIDQFRLICNNKFDFISVNETLCDDTIHDSEIHLDGYNILRKDRYRGGGGVALYIRNTYIFNRRDDLCNNNVECI